MEAIGEQVRRFDGEDVQQWRLNDPNRETMARSGFEAQHEHSAKVRFEVICNVRNCEPDFCSGDGPVLDTAGSSHDTMAFWRKTLWEGFRSLPNLSHV